MNFWSWMIAAVLSALMLTAATIASAQTAGAGGSAADTNRGELAYNNSCRTCHTLREGDNRLGPSLHGVVGRKSGAAPGYAFSSALADGKFVWDSATLDKFIANPDAVAPGNNMKPFTGVGDQAERAAIIAFLQSASKT